MSMLRVLLFLAVTSMASFCYAGGVLANVKKIQVEPTVIEHPEKVKDAVAAKLVRYDLRAAVKDAILEEGESPIRTHFVLDEFSSQGATKKLMNFGTGRTIRTVDGRLVIQDATGRELASVKVHVRGSVALDPDEASNAQGRRPVSDLEQRLLEEIERLK